MIDFNVIWLLSIVLYLFSFLALIIIAKMAYKPIDNEKKIFTRIFPFELVNNIGENYKFYRIALFVFSGLCFSPIFCLVNYFGLYSELKLLAILIATLFGLSGVVFSFVHFFNPSNVKTHLILDIVFVGLTILSGMLSLVLCINLLKINSVLNISVVSKIVLGAALVLIITGYLIYLVLGKLKDWAKLENIDSVIRRPKYFPLACLEWVTGGVLFIEEILFFLVLLLV